jgi:hypothetical protein
MQDHVGKPRVDKFGRERKPEQFLYDDNDNVVATGAQAIAMVSALTPPAPTPPTRSRVQTPARLGRAPRAATNARRRGSRRGQRSSSSSSDDPDGEPPPPPAGGWLTFERFDRLTALLPPHWRCRLFHRLPRRLQDQTWDALAAELERSRR